jgi:hypothetical protein
MLTAAEVGARPRIVGNGITPLKFQAPALSGAPDRLRKLTRPKTHDCLSTNDIRKGHTDLPMRKEPLR